MNIDHVQQSQEIFVEPKTTHGQLAQRALLKEIYLSPKPGLVDKLNNGAHKDMCFATFLDSIEAISPWMDKFYYCGIDYHHLTISNFLPQLRLIGIECEQQMFSATNHINTHKGGIFSFSLLLSAIGRLEKQQKIITYHEICNEVAGICENLVENELKRNNNQQTKGEQLYLRYGLKGARGEAESGYQTVINIALPVYQMVRQQSYPEDICLLQTLLYLLAYNQDTNLVSRGGIAGLTFVQQKAKDIIAQGGALTSTGIQQIYALDQVLIEKNLSPGGSADLLSITYFLSHY